MELTDFTGVYFDFVQNCDREDLGNRGIRVFAFGPETDLPCLFGEGRVATATFYTFTALVAQTSSIRSTTVVISDIAGLRKNITLRVFHSIRFGKRTCTVA